MQRQHCPKARRSTNVAAVPYADQLKEVRRELALRKRKYPEWVAKGTLTQSAADKHMELMKAVAETLEPLAKSEGLF